MFKPSHSIKRYILIGLVLFLTSSAQGGTVVGSKHDFRTATSPEVCVFWHTPHFANPNINGPLWNRAINQENFTVYSSPTIDNSPSQPSPISRLCLGCHDGVLSTETVYGNILSTKHVLVFYHGMPDTTSYANCRRCHGEIYGDPPNNFRLGTDLSNDHPISMTYPTAQEDPKFNIPPDSQNGWPPGDVRLVEGKIECVSCHDVHNSNIQPFLIKSNAGSVLCLTCHSK